MKKLAIHVHTNDAEHWVTMNGAAVLVDGTEGGGFTVKGGAGGKLTGLKVNPKSMSEPRLNAKTSQFNRPDFKPHEPEPPKPAAPVAVNRGLVGRARPGTAPKSPAELQQKAAESALATKLEAKGGKYNQGRMELGPGCVDLKTGEAVSKNPEVTSEAFARYALAGEPLVNIHGQEYDHGKKSWGKPAAPAHAARQYISAAKLDHPSVGALNNATAQKEAAHAKLKSINRKDDPLGHLKADSAHRDAVRNEASAREAVEAAANRLGQTTISPAGAKKAADEAEKLMKLREAFSNTAQPKVPAPGFLGANADPAAVNAPLSKRGDLNAEIDRHKARQAAEAKTKAKESAATSRAEKAEAKALISEHGPAIIAKMGERFGAKNIAGMLDQWAKWEPKKAILFVEKFKAEQAGRNG